MPQTPPRVAAFLLCHLLGRRPSRPYILADLGEEFANRSIHSPRSARWWYWREALRLGLRFRLSAGRGTTDPADLTGPTGLTGDHMRLELRLAWRAVSRRPLLSGAMILTIGLAIAAATTVFAVVHGVLLKPLPYRDPGELVAIWETNPQRGRFDNVASPANYLAWRDRAGAFSAMASLVQFGAALTGDGEPEQVGVMQATAEYFTIVGATPLVGRLYGTADDAPEAPAVVVLAEGFWRRRYGADPSVVGRSINLNGQLTQIVGVLPARYDFVPRVASFFSTGGRDVWVPAQFEANAREAGGRYLQVIARLAPGSSLSQAQAEMSTLAATLRTEFVERQAGWDVRVAPLRDDLVGNARTAILVVFAAVGLVLLVAAANVADLQLTRTLERQQEIAVRAALGAGRGRLVRQLLTEGFLIAGLGGVAGLAFATWATGALLASAPGLPRLDEVGLSLPVLAFAAVITVGSALAFGLAPAFSLGKSSLAGWLTHRATTARAGSHRARRLLVGLQVAFSFMLLLGAALLVRSMVNRLQVDIGIDPEGVAVADLSLPRARYPTSSDRLRFYQELLGRIEQMPGVSAASATSIVPMAGSGQATGFRPLDRPPPAPGEAPVADVRFVLPGYHDALGIGLVEGRLLQDTDLPGAPLAVLINETGARLLWPGESAVGKRIEMEWGDVLDAEVVGVVRDVNLIGPDVAVDRSTLYWAAAQTGMPGTMTLVTRVGGDPTQLLSQIRGAVAELDPESPLFNAGTMSALVARAVSRARFISIAFGVFAALALLLATLGLYGVIASATQQRTREIGIRMALGASGPAVRGMVLREGFAVIAPAILVGAGVSAVLAGALRSMVFGVSPGDPVTFVAVGLLLATTAAFACWIPARRASGVDPVEAMRVE